MRIHKAMEINDPALVAGTGIMRLSISIPKSHKSFDAMSTS